MGAKYRELGKRQPISVGFNGPDYAHLRYAIYQGAGLYQGRIGDKYLKEMSWATEAEAQAFLDRVAKVRGWKKV